VGIGSRIQNAFRLVFRRRQVEAELDEEVRAYYDTLAERLVAKGMSEAEARRTVRQRYSGAEQVKERVRDVRVGAFFDRLLRDVRYALRGIRKDPTFAIVTILTLGLGIGANATVFSLVNRFALRPPPVEDPSRLFALYTMERGENCCSNNQSYPLYADLRDQAKSFSEVAAYHDLLAASIDHGGDPERIWGQAATTNFFTAARLPLVLGRGFRPEEDTTSVVVLGHRLWRRRFQEDPNVVGKVVQLSGQPFTVIGVAPPAFRGLDLVLDSEFWVPLGMYPVLQGKEEDRSDRGNHWLSVVARLAPSANRQAAESELEVIGRRLSAAYPAFHKDLRFRLETAGSVPVRFRQAAAMFFVGLAVVSLLVFCIACANVANLAQARAAGRQQESAVRLALGATRGHLLAQMLTESTLLAIAGGVAAAAFSLWATKSLGSFRIPAPVPLDLAIPLDWRVLLFTFGLSVAAGIFCGLVPAWTVRKGAVANAIKGQDLLASPGRFWTLGNVLVALQLTMSVILLCSTGLFLRSLHQAARIEIGFRSRGVLMVDVDPRLHGYSPQRTAQMLELARQKASEIPGVEAAAFGDTLPLSGGHRSDGMTVTGQAGPPRIVDLFMVSADYLRALGIPLVAGRDFGRAGANAEPVAIVDEEFVRQFFPDGQALDKQVSDGDRSYRIIGVAGDIKSRTLGEPLRPVLFRSLAQDIEVESSFSGYSLLVSYRGNGTDVAARMRDTIRQIDPGLAIVRARTMEEHIEDAFFLPRLGGAMFTVFGLLGLILTSVGLYGLMNYWVSRRKKEIGVRLAIGARVGQVQALVLKKGMLLVAVALVPGLLAALGLSKLYASFLYGVGTGDPLTFAFVPVFLTIVALVACWIPARRISGAEPLQALRDE
jgi:predicted permease